MLSTASHFAFGHNAQPALTETQLFQAAPSIFASAAHESRSARYAYIPTVDVLRGLLAQGFKAYAATESRCRDTSHKGYVKHMVRLRHADSVAKVGETVNEVCLVNSHNGTSAYQMFAGVFRAVCANGLVVHDSTIDTVKVQHSGKATDKVVEGAFHIMAQFDRVDEAREAFQGTSLSAAEQRVFAHAALATRFGTEALPPVTAEQALTPRRREDHGDSLWQTFQRVQENLVQGGLRTSNRERRTRTRAVNGIDGNVALNRGLWVLAEEMRKLRGQAVAA